MPMRNRYDRLHHLEKGLPMLSIRIALLALALLATPSTSGDQSTSAGQQTTSTGTAAISGGVTDAVTGRPIAGASVSISISVTGAAGRPLAPPPMLTDARGRFVVIDLPATH
jgi:hypothetical protein